jgi:23S rRNA pseudouridine2605 synthase
MMQRKKRTAIKGENEKSGSDKNPELTRLNKYIASTGLCSRRTADEYIKNGLITVNDKVITELGVKIKPGDVVKYGGRNLTEQRKVYIILNKPKDCVTTTRDSQGKRTVFDLVNNSDKERIYPVGRLDRNTTGVLLLTNDGDLTKKLTHPKYNKLKIYHVYLDKAIKSSDRDKIAEGVTLEDGFIKVDSINFVNSTDKKQVGVEIHSGRNRIIRRIFEHLGYKIIRLDRVYFAGLTKKGLPRGKWRYLSSEEVSILKRGSYR